MSRIYWNALTCVVVCGLALVIGRDVRAATITKLGLGGDAMSDIEYDSTTLELKTIDDGDATTAGNQNTRVEFLGFLQGVFADITTPVASFTMEGLMASGSPTDVAGVVVTQGFTGGSITLYDDNNDELLIATLGDSFLVGPLGPPATGAVFNTTFATVTGGSVQPHVIDTTLSLSMSLTDVNNGAGFSTSGVMNPVLNSFHADVTLNIAAEPIPEPGSILLVLLGGLLIAALIRCGRPGPM